MNPDFYRCEAEIYRLTRRKGLPRLGLALPRGGGGGGGGAY
jgi:hypothetical protein